MENQKTSGDFRPSEKFVEFVGSKGNVNFISNEALIEGKLLSGLGFENMTFKLTIYEDGTVDFDDVENQTTTKEQRKNLLDVITEKTITPFRKRMVVRELKFTSVNEVDEKKINLYLAVEYNKPIDKLASIFDDEVSISDEQSSKLDNLLSMFDDEEPKLSQVESESDEELVSDLEGENDIEVIATETEPVFDYNKQLEDSFSKIKQEKIATLRKDLEDKKVNLKKLEKDKKFAESKIEECNADIRLLESRIESLQPQAEPNGWYFNVSERLNEKVVLEEDIYEIIKSKVSKVKGINTDAFMKLFEDGEFRIRVSKKTDGIFEELIDLKEIPKELVEPFSDLKLTIREDEIYYIGEVIWADLVNKFIKLGFCQDSEWDKNCNSNSYNVTEDII